MEFRLRNFGHTLEDVKYPCIDIRDSGTAWIWLDATTWIEMDREFFDELQEGFMQADQ